MKKTIISLGIVALNLCASFALPINAQAADSSKRQNSPSNAIQINGFEFKLIGCQLNHTSRIYSYGNSSSVGTLCNLEIKNKQNSPRILRYNHALDNSLIEASFSSHFVTAQA